MPEREGEPMAMVRSVITTYQAKPYCTVVLQASHLRDSTFTNSSYDQLQLDVESCVLRIYTFYFSAPVFHAPARAHWFHEPNG